MLCVPLSFPQQFQTGAHSAPPQVPCAEFQELGEAALGMLQGYPCPGSTALPSSYFGSSILAGLGPAGPAGPSGISAGISAVKVSTDLALAVPWNSSRRGNAGPENGALQKRRAGPQSN